MNKTVDPQLIEVVAQAFDSDFVTIPISSILPVKAIGKTVKSSHKYRQILASIREVGLVEPPAVIRDSRELKPFGILAPQRWSAYYQPMMRRSLTTSASVGYLRCKSKG